MKERRRRPAPLGPQTQAARPRRRLGVVGERCYGLGSENGWRENGAFP